MGIKIEENATIIRGMGEGTFNTLEDICCSLTKFYFKKLVCLLPISQQFLTSSCI